MPIAIAHAGALDAPGLRIQLLGRFRVWVGAQPIPDTAWRAKAARLFKLLALSPGHRLHREQVLERFWPDLEQAAATNNLHRTLYFVRRVLEPRLGPGTASAYLRMQGEMVGLSALRGLWIDVEAFELASTVAR